VSAPLSPMAATILRNGIVDAEARTVKLGKGFAPSAYLELRRALDGAGGHFEPMRQVTVFPEDPAPIVERLLQEAATSLVAGPEEGALTPEAAAPAGPSSRTVPIDSIARDILMQARANYDWETIRDYARAYQEGVALPPVSLTDDGEHLYLTDGWHRVRALEDAGIDVVPAVVRPGTRREAILAAVESNHAHGLRRSNADKRRAVEILLRDEEWVRWSDREVARRAGVHHDLVATVRREFESTGGIRQLNSRVGGDGKERPVPPRPPAHDPEPLPDDDVVTLTAVQSEKIPAIFVLKLLGWNLGSIVRERNGLWSYSSKRQSSSGHFTHDEAAIELYRSTTGKRDTKVQVTWPEGAFERLQAFIEAAAEAPSQPEPLIESVDTPAPNGAAVEDVRSNPPTSDTPAGGTMFAPGEMSELETWISRALDAHTGTTYRVTLSAAAAAFVGRVPKRHTKPGSYVYDEKNSTVEKRCNLLAEALFKSTSQHEASPIGMLEVLARLTGSGDAHQVVNTNVASPSQASEASYFDVLLAPEGLWVGLADWSGNDADLPRLVPISYEMTQVDDLILRARGDKAVVPGGRRIGRDIGGVEEARRALAAGLAELERTTA
jgi:hypothetical protein